MSLVNPATVIVVQKAGAQTAVNGAVPPIVLPRDAELVGVQVALGTAPTGATFIANVAKNGTKIFSGAARPTIAINAFAGTAILTAKDANAGVNVIAPTVTQTTALATFAAGDTIRVDVDQVGSTVAGSDLSVALELRFK